MEQKMEQKISATLFQILNAIDRLAKKDDITPEELHDITFCFGGVIEGIKIISEVK